MKLVFSRKWFDSGYPTAAGTAVARWSHAPTHSQDLDARVDALIDARPHQPLVQVVGKLRFWGNPVVGALLDRHPLDLPALLAMDFAPDEMAQFVQLLGLGSDEVRSLGLAVPSDPTASEGPAPLHPIQPLRADSNGTVRFRANAVVNHLLDTGPVTLNDLAVLEEATQPHWEHLAQLIGYSHDGAGDFRHMSDRVLEESWRLWETRAMRRAALRGFHGAGAPSLPSGTSPA